MTETHEEPRHAESRFARPESQPPRLHSSHRPRRRRPDGRHAAVPRRRGTGCGTRRRRHSQRLRQHRRRRPHHDRRPEPGDRPGRQDHAPDAHRRRARRRLGPRQGGSRAITFPAPTVASSLAAAWRRPCTGARCGRSEPPLAPSSSMPPPRSGASTPPSAPPRRASSRTPAVRAPSTAIWPQPPRR